MTSQTSLIVSTALFWVGGYGLGRDIDLEQTLAQAHARADALAHEAERASLLALRAHLDPHFLFNTLNAIAEWCREDGATAERATLELSAMLRTVLDGTHRSAWPAARELELSRNLLDLHRIRDPDKLQVDVDLDDAPGLEVPPLILLPLTENAVKHRARGGGRVQLRARTEDDAFVFEVENPGVFGGERSGGQGLALVRRRLDHAYAGRAKLTIETVGDRTRARVTIPLSARVPEVNA
jgi:LytS/YehU family sensor histidine kinase